MDYGFLLSYAIFFGGAAVIVAVVMNLDSRKRGDRHPAAGE